MNSNLMIPVCICFFLMTSLSFAGDAQELKPSWLTPKTQQVETPDTIATEPTPEPNRKVIFLEGSEVTGNAPRPLSRFDADHLAKTIRPFMIHKNVRAILEHYDPQAYMKARLAPFYDSRPDRRHW